VCFYCLFLVRPKLCHSIVFLVLLLVIVVDQPTHRSRWLRGDSTEFEGPPTRHRKFILSITLETKIEIEALPYSPSHIHTLTLEHFDLQVSETFVEVWVPCFNPPLIDLPNPILVQVVGFTSIDL